MLCGKKQKPANAGNQQKAFQNKKTPIDNGYHYQKTAKELQIWYLSIILSLIIRKATFSFNGKLSLITLSNTLRVAS